jgi:hypothetical protein
MPRSFTDLRWSWFNDFFCSVFFSDESFYAAGLYLLNFFLGELDSSIISVFDLSKSGSLSTSPLRPGEIFLPKATLNAFSSFFGSYSELPG